MYYLVQTDTQTFGCHSMFRNWAALDGPNGISLLSVRFHSDDDQASFESLAGVEALPNTGTISEDQAITITAIGLAVTIANTTAEVREMAKQQYPAM
jgi:hypothetical protein